jgi:4-amino-4-deoxy-L-arabinose transferase-like glycosyltransferase
MSPPPSPSGSADPAAERRLRLGLLALLVALAVLRLAAAGAIPLTEDEAYYRLWAQAPRLGYYDHPPMVAWWIWAGIRIAGDTALGVRLLPVAASLISTLLVFDLGQRLPVGLPARRSGLAAALLYNATITVGAGALLAVPDVPASLFWLAALWAMARAERQPLLWLGAGAAAGLACLSKYSALFLAPGVVLWLALTRDGRRALLTPWPWLAAAIAAALFAVNVAWNAQHHWLTFAKQFGRVEASRFAPRYLGEFLAAQFVLLNPLVAVLAGAGAARAWKQRALPEGRIAVMALLTSLPFAAYLILHSLHDRVQAHWPVPLYAAAALLAALAAQDGRGWKGVLARIAPVGLALCALGLGYMSLPRGLLPKGDPADALRGWPMLAEQVEGVAEAHGAAWVGTLSYGVNGLLQAQGALRLPALQLNERDRYADLPRPAADLSRPGLVVDLKRRVDLQRLRACFAVVGAPTEIVRGLGGGPDSRYVAVPVAGPRTDLPARGCEAAGR